MNNDGLIWAEAKISSHYCEEIIGIYSAKCTAQSEHDSVSNYNIHRISKLVHITVLGRREVSYTKTTKFDRLQKVHYSFKIETKRG